MIEQQVIGCFLQDNSLIKDTAIQTKHFTNPIYKIMFSEMMKLSNEDKSIDIYMLMDRLYDKVDYQKLMDTTTSLETAGNINQFDTYERELIDRYINRETKQILTKYTSEEQVDTDALIDDLENLKRHKRLEDGNLFDLYMQLHEEPYKPETIKRGISTGFISLDRKFSFVDTELTIVAARPSIGKTALMLKFVNSCLEHGVVPLVFSLEMGEESLVRRLIAQRLNVDSRVVRHSSLLSDNQKSEWQKEVTWLSEKPHEVYTEIRTIPEIRTKVRQAKRNYPDKRIIVFIDYLTLLETDLQFQSENYKVSYYSRSLKHMAMDFDIPVVSLAQLSRGVEQRQDKRPILSDLRDSGAVEQDANNVLLLYRDSYYDEDTDKPYSLEINIAKQREGPTGTVEVFYNKVTGLMRDMA